MAVWRWIAVRRVCVAQAAHSGGAVLLAVGRLKSIALKMEERFYLAAVGRFRLSLLMNAAACFRLARLRATYRRPNLRAAAR